MDEAGLIKSMKSGMEETHTLMCQVEESLTEIASAVGATHMKVVDLSKRFPTGAPGLPQNDLLTQIRSQLSANSALIAESLKVGHKNLVRENTGSISGQNSIID